MNELHGVGSAAEKSGSCWLWCGIALQPHSCQGGQALLQTKHAYT